MCGIVGLFIKNPELQSQLGNMLSDMLIEMSDRGPDSAGIAIYRDPVGEDACKVTVMSTDPDYSWVHFELELKKVFGQEASIQTIATHSVIRVPNEVSVVLGWLADDYPELLVTSSGRAIEIYKQTGLPKHLIDRFGLREMSGTHALGHTRMATESAVTTDASHPFSTGNDTCLVHNGSLSNHNSLRREMQRHGVTFHTENDTEVAAGYLMWKLQEGASLEDVLKMSLDDLDGFFTFAVGTRDGFAVMRDHLACKPAVLAETDDWAAMSSEFRAIAQLPGAEGARIWEPGPAEIYTWQH